MSLSLSTSRILDFIASQAMYFASCVPADKLRRDIIYQSNHGDILVKERPFYDVDGDLQAISVYKQCEALIETWVSGSVDETDGA